MKGEMGFMDPIEDPPDYLLTVGERWACPCGGGFWQQIDSMPSCCSSWVWCPHCGACAAWMAEPEG